MRQKNVGVTRSTWSEWSRCLLFVAGASAVATGAACGEERRTLWIHGREQSLHIYGPLSGDPIIVSSGDGGWLHLAPHVSELLAERGYFVVGFDVKGYLESVTSRTTALHVEDEPADFRVLAQFAGMASGKKPILVGVSEGAGLSVLAATGPEVRSLVAGIVALGLPDVNELGWRWTDSVIYLTHRTPSEPTFSTSSIVGKVAPLPLAAIHSTHDEFVPLPEIQDVLQHAGEPKKLWIINASNHRFSDNLSEFDRRLVDAVEWVACHAR